MLIIIRRFESERNPEREREHEGGRAYESSYRPERSEGRERRYSPEREERKRKYEMDDDLAAKRRKDVCYRCGGVTSTFYMFIQPTHSNYHTFSLLSQ